MDFSLYQIICLLILAVCIIVGFSKGFIQMLGNIGASVLSLAFFWAIRNWAFDSFLTTLLFERGVLLVRIVLCIIIYVVLFLVLKAILTSLKFLAKLPIIKGVNKLLGLVAGGVFGMILIGVMTLFTEWLGK